jgi:hypothetical protein
MQWVKKLFWAAAASTAVYTASISSPWWSAAKAGRYDMLINLTVPSIFLLILSYYLLQKKYEGFSKLLSLFIIVLQISVALTLYLAIRGYS